MKNIILIALFLAVSSVWADEAAREIASSGQPTPSDLASRAEAGFVTVIDLRTPAELRGFDEAAVVKSLGMRYESLPVAGVGDLNEENATRLSELLDASDGPVLVHCGSGNRVGALFSVLRRTEGYSVEESIAYGKKLGLTSLEGAVSARLPAIETGAPAETSASEESEP